MISFLSYLIDVAVGAAFGMALNEVLHAPEALNEHDPSDPNSCKCGHNHPLVAEFGQCGRCWQEELKN